MYKGIFLLAEQRLSNEWGKTMMSYTITGASFKIAQDICGYGRVYRVNDCQKYIWVASCVACVVDWKLSTSPFYRRWPEDIINHSFEYKLWTSLVSDSSERHHGLYITECLNEIELYTSVIVEHVLLQLVGLLWRQMQNANFEHGLAWVGESLSGILYDCLKIITEWCRSYDLLMWWYSFRCWVFINHFVSSSGLD